MNIEDLLRLQPLGNPLLAWLYAGLVFFFTAVGVRLLLRFLTARMAMLTERTQTRPTS
ncbi:MAG: hypothetical protein KDI35_08530 [Gammaproteobacteria bacterium]|nr:hypothetical protein [Gammaproteobacteria bacterium]